MYHNYISSFSLTTLR